MGNFINGFTFSIFDIFSYIFPGGLLLFFLSTFFSSNQYDLFSQYYIFILIASYFVGQFIHQISTIFNNWIENYAWVHKKDTSCSIKNFIVCLFYPNIRDTILMHEDANKKLKGVSKYGYLSLYYIKEVIVEQNPTFNSSFGYLEYLKIFNESTGIIFLIFGWVYFSFSLFTKLNIHLFSMKLYISFYHGLIILLIFVFISIIFIRRSTFFKNSKRSIIDAYIISLYDLNGKVKK